jgi:hypothetical protein
MTKRRLLRWSLILAILAAFAVWLDPTRVVWGWLRGEAFYQGRPTSYWRNVIERDLQTEPSVLVAKTLGFRLPADAGWWDRFKQWLSDKMPAASSQELITWNRDTSGVLQALSNDPDAKISGFAKDAMHYRLWAAPRSYWLETIRKYQ